jgi:hypothetical protein
VCSIYCLWLLSGELTTHETATIEYILVEFPFLLYFITITNYIVLWYCLDSVDSFQKLMFFRGRIQALARANSLSHSMENTIYFVFAMTTFECSFIHVIYNHGYLISGVFMSEIV